MADPLSLTRLSTLRTRAQATRAGPYAHPDAKAEAADVLEVLAALEGAEAERNALQEAAQAIDQPATAAIGRLRVRGETATAGLLAHALTGLRRALEGKGDQDDA